MNESVFTTIKVSTTSGKTFVLRNEDTGYDRLFWAENVPVLKNGQLFFVDCQKRQHLIASVVELAAYLYFNDVEYINPNILIPAFSYFCSVSSVEEVIAKLGNEDAFEALTEIDTDDFDVDEVLEILSDGLEEYEAYGIDGAIEDFRSFVNKVTALADIATIEFKYSEPDGSGEEGYLCVSLK